MLEDRNRANPKTGLEEPVYMPGYYSDVFSSLLDCFFPRSAFSFLNMSPIVKNRSLKVVK